MIDEEYENNFIFQGNNSLNRTIDFASHHNRQDDALYIFAQDINESGAKLYLASTLYNFFWLMEKCTSDNTHHQFKGRHFHEVILPGWSCKLYFDLEYNNEENSDVDGSELVTLLSKAISDFIYDGSAIADDFIENYGDDPIFIPNMLKSCDEKKTSYHVIYDIKTKEDGVYKMVMFENNQCVGDFVRQFQIFCQHNERYHALFINDRSYNNRIHKRFFADMGVYKSKQTMRTIFSRKRGSKRTLLSTTKSKRELTYDNFVNHLITVLPKNVDCVDKVFKIQNDGAMKNTVKDICQDPSFDLIKGIKNFPCTHIYTSDACENEYLASFDLCYTFPHLLTHAKILEYVSKKWPDISLESMNNIFNRSPFNLLISTKNILSCPYVKARTNGDHRKPGKTYIIIDLKNGRYYRKCFSAACHGQLKYENMTQTELAPIHSFFAEKINGFNLLDFYTTAESLFEPYDRQYLQNWVCLYRIVDIIGADDQMFTMFCDKAIPALFEKKIICIKIPEIENTDERMEKKYAAYFNKVVRYDVENHLNKSQTCLARNQTLKRLHIELESIWDSNNTDISLIRSVVIVPLRQYYEQITNDTQHPYLLDEFSSLHCLILLWRTTGYTKHVWVATEWMEIRRVRPFKVHFFTMTRPYLCFPKNRPICSNSSKVSGGTFVLIKVVTFNLFRFNPHSLFTRRNFRPLRRWFTSARNTLF